MMDKIILYIAKAGGATALWVLMIISAGRADTQFAVYLGLGVFGFLVFGILLMSSEWAAEDRQQKRARERRRFLEPGDGR